MFWIIKAVGNNKALSDVFQQQFLLGTLQPVRGPAGFDAGPVLQEGVVLGQFGVTPRRQPAQQEAKAQKKRDCCVEPRNLFVSPESEQKGDGGENHHVCQRETLSCQERARALLETRTESLKTWPHQERLPASAGLTLDR